MSACDDLGAHDPDDVILLGLLRRCRGDHELIDRHDLTQLLEMLGDPS